jgi:hypothetical protein
LKIGDTVTRSQFLVLAKHLNDVDEHLRVILRPIGVEDGQKKLALRILAPTGQGAMASPSLRA